MKVTRKIHRMHYRRLGRTDLRVSEVGFGAWAAGGGGWASHRRYGGRGGGYGYDLHGRLAGQPCADLLGDPGRRVRDPEAVNWPPAFAIFTMNTRTELRPDMQNSRPFPFGIFLSIIR